MQQDSMKQNQLELLRKAKDIQFNLTGTKYKSVETIGSGAYGVVCSAINMKTQARVAIKKISAIFNHLSVAKRTYREVKMLKHLKHDNIISICDIIKPNNIESFTDIYIVLDLMESDLHRIIHSTQEITEEHARYFLYQLLRGLKFVHSANIIHRDLKPSNLLVNENCDLKIGDFGLARGIASTSDILQYQLTQYVATRWYRAPELTLAFLDYSTAVDLWSVGCIFAEMIGRKHLFPGRQGIHQIELITNILGSPGPDVIKQSSSDVIRDMLSSEKIQRCQRKSFRVLYPQASDHAINLLDKLLLFNPTDRLTAEQALAHPFLGKYHDAEDEPVCIPAFNFDFENKQMSQKELKQSIWDEIMDYHRPKETFKLTNFNLRPVKSQSTSIASNCLTSHPTGGYDSTSVEKPEEPGNNSSTYDLKPVPKNDTNTIFDIKPVPKSEVSQIYNLKRVPKSEIAQYNLKPVPKEQMKNYDLKPAKFTAPKKTKDSPLDRFLAEVDLQSQAGSKQSQKEKDFEFAVPNFTRVLSNKTVFSTLPNESASKESEDCIITNVTHITPSTTASTHSRLSVDSTKPVTDIDMLSAKSTQGGSTKDEQKCPGLIPLNELPPLDPKEPQQEPQQELPKPDTKALIKAALLKSGLRRQQQAELQREGKEKTRPVTAMQRQKERKEKRKKKELSRKKKNKHNKEEGQSLTDADLEILQRWSKMKPTAPGATQPEVDGAKTIILNHGIAQGIVQNPSAQSSVLNSGTQNRTVNPMAASHPHSQQDSISSNLPSYTEAIQSKTTIEPTSNNFTAAQPQQGDMYATKYPITHYDAMPKFSEDLKNFVVESGNSHRHSGDNQLPTFGIPAESNSSQLFYQHSTVPPSLPTNTNPIIFPGTVNQTADLTQGLFNPTLDNPLLYNHTTSNPLPTQPTNYPTEDPAQLFPSSRLTQNVPQNQQSLYSADTLTGPSAPLSNQFQMEHNQLAQIQPRLHRKKSDTDLTVLISKMSKSNVQDLVLIHTPKGTGSGYGVGVDMEDMVSDVIMGGLSAKSKSDSAPLSATLLLDWWDVSGMMKDKDYEALQMDLGSPFNIHG